MAVLFCFSSWTLPSMRTSMSHLGSHGFTLDDVWINRQENYENSCVAVGVSVNSNKLLGSPSCPSYALYYHGLVAWECKIISWINHCYWLALRACVGLGGCRMSSVWEQMINLKMTLKATLEDLDVNKGTGSILQSPKNWKISSSV